LTQVKKDPSSYPQLLKKEVAAWGLWTINDEILGR
jgi:hypothetical protein